jgi:hypothetical protein
MMTCHIYLYPPTCRHTGSNCTGRSRLISIVRLQNHTCSNEWPRLIPRHSLTSLASLVPGSASLLLPHWFHSKSISQAIFRDPTVAIASPRLNAPPHHAYAMLRRSRIVSLGTCSMVPGSDAMSLELSAQLTSSNVCACFETFRI